METMNLKSNIQIHVKFIKLLLKHGSLKSKSINFDAKRAADLSSIPENLLPKTIKLNKTFWNKIRSIMLRNSILRILISNLAFLKNHKRTYIRLFIEKDRNLIYLRIFKNGSTSILKSLLPEMHKPIKDHSLSDKQIDSLAHYLEVNQLPRIPNKYTAFVVVRNPLERLVSAYVDIFEVGDYDNFLFSVFEKGMSFNELLNRLQAIPNYLRGPHFVSQSKIINSANLTKIQIFKINEDKSALHDFLSQFNLTLYYTNKSTNQQNYLSYYNQENIRLAYKIYEDDFVNLGYEETYARDLRLIEAN